MSQAGNNATYVFHFEVVVHVKGPVPEAQARTEATPELEAVNEEPDLQEEVKSETPQPDEVQVGPQGHLTPTPSPEPTSAAKRPGKATMDEFIRMGLYIANNGGENYCAEREWQAFVDNDIRNIHRTTKGWAGIYKHHSNKLHEMVEEINAGRSH
ncbi:hypothetical protein PENSPDRAFT_686877 [Peniophora sp. CONT]|nr:hypothetical protein PENSPDRAFT_686877 [Peniophora sp. CONT]